MNWFDREMERKGAFWRAWKVLCGLGTVLCVLMLYYPVSRMTAGRQHHLLTVIDEAIPLIPWTWWIYFPGYLAGILFCLLVMKREQVVYKTCAAIIIAQLCCVAVYMVYPSSFPRPRYDGAGLTGDALRWFWSFDPPNNTFPSSHVMIAFSVALAMWREQNPYRWVQYISATGVLITIHTTKQHYVVDGAAGLGLACFCHWLVYDWWPSRAGAASYESPKSNV